MSRRGNYSWRAFPYAVGDGYRPVVVPEDIAVALGGLTDLNGKSMVDLGRFEEEFNESFEFQFVRPEDLTPKERDVYALLGPVAVLAELDLGRLGVRDVLISETMRLSSAGAEFLAVWEPAEARVVVRRDQLQSARSFCGSLLHELEHAGIELLGWHPRVRGRSDPQARHGRQRCPPVRCQSRLRGPLG